MSVMFDLARGGGKASVPIQTLEMAALKVFSDAFNV